MHTRSLLVGAFCRRMWPALVCGLALVLVGCARSVKEPWTVVQPPEGMSVFLQHCSTERKKTVPWPVVLPEGSLAFSFGRDFVAEPNSSDQEWMLRCVYSGFLHAMGETALWPSAPGTEVYRFTWIRSFDNPVVIRVERRGAVYQVHAKQMDSGSIYIGPLNAHRTRLLSPSEWSELRRKLAVASFWNRGTLRMHQGYVVSYLDGADWLFEGLHEGRYRAYEVFSPDEDGEAGAFRMVGLYLLQLSGLSIPEDSVY